MQRSSEPARTSPYPRICKARLLDLPGEIMFEIAKHVFLDDDLSYLVRSCRFTFNLLNLELYKRSCKRDNFALLWASKTGSIGSVRHAPEMGADCNLKANGLMKILEDISLHRRSRLGTFALVQLCNSMRGKTSLVLAAENGHDNVIRLLLQDSRVLIPDLDAVYAATQNGHSTIVESLLSYNVLLSDHCGQSNTKLMHLAAGKGHDTVLAVILNRTDAKVGATDACGQTALHLAAKNGHRRTLKTLLDHDDADVNAKDERGNTPLHVALRNGHAPTVEALLDYSRTDVNMRDRNGLHSIHWIAKMDLLSRVA